MSEAVRALGRKIRAPFNKRSAFKELGNFHYESGILEQIVDTAIKFPSR